MNKPVLLSTTRTEELKEKENLSFRTIINPLIPSGLLFLITFAFTILFSQLSQMFIANNNINYVSRGLILASIFSFIMLIIKLTTILKQKIGHKENLS